MWIAAYHGIINLLHQRISRSGFCSVPCEKTSPARLEGDGAWLEKQQGKREGGLKSRGMQATIFPTLTQSCVCSIHFYKDGLKSGDSDVKKSLPAHYDPVAAALAAHGDSLKPKSTIKTKSFFDVNSQW